MINSGIVNLGKIAKKTKAKKIITIPTNTVIKPSGISTPLTTEYIKQPTNISTAGITNHGNTANIRSPTNITKNLSTQPPALSITFIIPEITLIKSIPPVIRILSHNTVKHFIYV